MTQPKPWLKMWVEWIDDPKMLSLTLAEQGAWWRLLTLAQRCMADGFLVKGNGAPLSLNEIASTLRFTTKPDRKVFDSMVQKMTDQGSLHWNSKALVVTHFAERQAKAASETPEAVRDRVRRHREKQSKTSKPLEPTTPHTPHLKFALDLHKEIKAQLRLLPSFKNRQLEHEIVREALMRIAETRHYLYTQELPTPRGRIDLAWSDTNHNPIVALEIDDRAPQENSLEKLGVASFPIKIIILRGSSIPAQLCAGILIIGIKESNKETPPPPKDIEGEGEGETTSLHTVTCHGKSVTPEAILAEIAKLHEEYFGIISPFFAEKFKDFVENYRGPVEWIALAFAEAVKYKNRRWEYVEAILYSWQEKGGPHADRKGPGGKGERLGANQRDPLSTYREAGWEVVGEDEPEAEAGDQD